MESDAEVNARLIREWRARASRLDDGARIRRCQGLLHGADGAEELEAEAVDYRAAATELELDGATGESRR